MSRASRSSGYARPRVLALALVVLSLVVTAASAQAGESSERVPLNRFPRMVQEFFVNQIRQVEREADRRREIELRLTERETRLEPGSATVARERLELVELDLGDLAPVDHLLADLEHALAPIRGLLGLGDAALRREQVPEGDGRAEHSDRLRVAGA